MIRAITYSRYHGKGDVGSTRLRVHQLYKYWPEYSEYKYGENPDVMVFQKVYMQSDWHFIAHFEGLKILDICDPDWLEYQNVKETCDAVDGVSVPTEALKDFLSQLTNKPIKVIPDRHDIENLPTLKQHKGKTKKAVWFGYSHNAELLKGVIEVLQRMDIELTIISNDNPMWLSEHQYRRFDEETIIADLREFDICVLPNGNRPKDRFKSNNKTTLAWLAGIPVVKDIEDLEKMMSPAQRNKKAKECYTKAIKEYDVKLSVKDMKEFIEELKNERIS